VIYGVNHDAVPHRFWVIIEVQPEGHGV